MTLLQLVLAPHPIFKQKAAPVEEVNDEIRNTIDNMFVTMYHEGAVGMGANMVGILKRIAIIDLQLGGKNEPYTLINPEITWKSDELVTLEEGSVCFPGISANITRPAVIEVSFLDYYGKPQKLKVDGPLARVIQHEVDYLNGIVFWDYLSKLKRDMLLAKMVKFKKQHPPHIHSASCRH
jgi:peptide deformylase